ncbi:GerAB/ArcD/ProY family transporter [Halalkalibacter alkalisediminis]|uniref:Endospore germination permease n=1 Tax=Halalkalibacter alkalisediminis TaxID=935616 RepID=A0ABV6NH49_9BACI|nr:endospore germination permease [Halalkalibacter alkalisediminis]
MVRISNTQLFMLIVAFEVGSTTLFALGIGAGRDAWIVVLLAALVGFCLLWVYTEIPKHYPDKHFSEILNDVLGKKLAAIMLFLFCLYFYSQASHNFYEFGRLIKITALPLSPLLLIWYLFILVVIYILCLGFEVLARTCEVLLPYLLFFLVTIYIFTLFSGQFDFDALRPVLGNGFQPVLESLAYTVGFPFGEMVVFLMFLHLAETKQLIRKTVFLAVGLSTVLLMISLIIMISVLGPELTANSEIPLLETILTINIAEIITNLDSIAVFIMFIGGFYKTALHFYGFSLTVTWLFKRLKLKSVMIIFGLSLPLFVHFRFPTFAHQRWYGEMSATYMIPLFAFLPVLLFIIMIMKKKKNPPHERRMMMPDILSVIKEDLLSGILLVGGSLYAAVLVLVMLYHTVTLLFKR